MRIAFTLVMFFLIAIGCFGQYTNRENFDLRNPGSEKQKQCSEILTTLASIPDEDRFTTLIRHDSIIVVHSNEEWFWQLFPGRNDGIAVDLVSKNQYQCDNINRISSTWSHKGFLLAPLYRDDIKRNLLELKPGYVGFYAGKVPAGIRNSEIEPNYILIQNKYLCSYTSIVNIEMLGWAPLKIGLYYDTLRSAELESKYKDISKTLHFSIPFEKDKAEYKEADIRPLYDSLKLTDYEIKSIRIHAFTSVEGSVSRNESLQTLRAESIVKALQAFQPEKLKSNILTSENWVDFLQDIISTPFQPMALMSKSEIKENLKSQDLLTKIEPILKKHRKAIIELELEKRVLYLKSNGDQLKKYFDQQIVSKNLEEALYLQQIIFYKIQKHDLAESFIDELKIPESLEYGSLLVNEASFRFEHGNSGVGAAITAFEKLDILLKNNPKVKYNLCALKLQGWLSSPTFVDPVLLKKDIDALRKMGIPDVLIRKLNINYHILLSELNFRNRRYAEKDKSVKFIYDSYKALHLQDDDLVSIAKYFSYHSRFKWAEEALTPRIKSLDVSEDALFYYLNLTIYHTKNTNSTSYRTIMLNAVNANKLRFCKLFNSIKEGGVSFQLLDDPYLRNTFCENCAVNSQP